MDMKLIVQKGMPKEAEGRFICDRCGKQVARTVCLVEMFNPTRQMTAKLCVSCVTFIPRSSQTARSTDDHDSSILKKPEAKDTYTIDGWDL